jgi:hypothetical protein
MHVAFFGCPVILSPTNTGTVFHQSCEFHATPSTQIVVLWPASHRKNKRRASFLFSSSSDDGVFDGRLRSHCWCLG